MLAVGPLGPQYSLLFAWYELGRHAHLGADTLPSQKVPHNPPTWAVLLDWVPGVHQVDVDQQQHAQDSLGTG